jgi:hypothetical protein
VEVIAQNLPESILFGTVALSGEIEGVRAVQVIDATLFTAGSSLRSERVLERLDRK